MPTTNKAADKKKELDEAIAEADTTLTKVKGDKPKMQATKLSKSKATALLAEFEKDSVWVIQEESTSTGTSTETGYVTLMISRTNPGAD